MTKPLDVPVNGTAIAIARNADEMVEAFCVVKNKLQLSNAFLEAMGLLAEGHIDKVLGPTRAKSLSPMIMDLLFETLAVEVHFHVNLDAAKRMESRWEGREQRNVRFEARPPSKKIIERAKPHVAKAMGSAGGIAANSIRSAAYRSELGRKAVKKRWRMERKRRREAKHENRMSSLPKEAQTEQGKHKQVDDNERKTRSERSESIAICSPAQRDSNECCERAVEKETVA